MRKSIWLILTLVVVFFSCSKDNDYVAPDIGHDYAGLEAGKYVVYDVDSFFYDDFNSTIDTSYFQIKEVVDSEYEDLEGEEAFKIIRYRKEIDSTSWVLIDVWYSKLTQTNFQKTEENNKFVKLIFPVRNNSTWNGNSMNNLDEMEYAYTSIDHSETVGGVSLNNVLTVLQYEFSPLTEENLFEEKYAKGIGLVYKKSIEIYNVYNTSTGLWERNSGFDITMTLSSYGG